MGETGRTSTLTTNLADVVYRQGRIDEAEELAQRGASLAPPDDTASQIGALYVRGKVAARKGSVAEGERLGRKAWEMVGRTQYLMTMAESAEALAEVLALAGKPDESHGFPAKGSRALRAEGKRRPRRAHAGAARRALEAGRGAS